MRASSALRPPPRYRRRQRRPLPPAAAGRGNLQNSWSVPSGNTLTPLFEAYTEITALVRFVEMNGEGFRKIVKKYDKTMGTNFLDRYV